ncbi:BREX system Lon protease-like protein BrxL [Cetobacterium sp.]|uniref:BREX system Lon protease-like protein BrxL n=1 Tax=Cetobacterium sp. TaxID=2071632 RepID=UPI003F2CDC60
MKLTNIKSVIDGLKKNQKATYLDLEENVPELENDEALKMYGSFIEDKSIKEKIKEILSASGICSEKNNTYVIFSELNKLIPFIQKNYNVILLGEGGLGKSSPYTTVFPFGEVISGVPTVANLRGSEKDQPQNANALLEKDLLVFEEIADDASSKGSVIPLLKTFLSSGVFKKCNKEEVKSCCSFVITSNEDSSIKSYEDLKAKDIFAPFPSGVKDYAFLNRFNAMIPHYRSLIYKREYVTSGEVIHCSHLYQVFSELRKLPNKIYVENNEEFDDRELGKINETINGFVKLFYIDKEPDPCFLSFIIEWAKHMCSLTNPRIQLHHPFNHHSLGLISELYLSNKQIKSICFLSKDRILIKYEDFNSEGYNAEILALSGFGKNENEFDLEYLNKCDTNKKSSLINLEKASEYKLKLKLNGDLVTSSKYDKNGNSLNIYITDHDYNELLLSSMNYSAKENEGFNQMRFRGIPKFFERIINSKIKLTFNLDNSKNPIPKTCYVIDEKTSSIEFINFYRIVNHK